MRTYPSTSRNFGYFDLTASQAPSPRFFGSQKTPNKFLGQTTLTILRASLCVHNRASLACISTGDSWIDRARWGARRLIAPDRRLTWNAPMSKVGVLTMA